MHVDSGKGGETERGPESSVDTKEDELEWERERKRAGWAWRRREGAEPLVAPPVNLRVWVIASVAVTGVEVAKAAWEEVEEEKESSWVKQRGWTESASAIYHLSTTMKHNSF